MISCDNAQPTTNHQTETPKALDENSSSYGIKRGYGDLVESLYNELSEKTPELSALKTQIENLAGSKSDSAESFNNYNNKNKSYYQSANNHLAQLHDTLLKEKIKQLIENSASRYNRSTAKHNELLKSIDRKLVTLNDLHTILKITRTLPLIEQYQRDAFPSTAALEGYTRQLDKTVRYADTLTKK